MKTPAWSGLLLVFAMAGTSAVLAQPASTRPAPGDEVMRPTQRGLRLNPVMARSISRLALREDYCKDMVLTDEQERQIADASSRRLMDIAHRDGREAGPAIEFIFETMIASDGKVTPQNAREFGEKMQPLMRAGRELLDGLADDARPVLDDEQFKQFEASIAKHRKAFERLEQRLAGYREGRLEKEEEPFDDLEKPDDELPGQAKVDQRIKQARQSADWQTRGPTSWEWSRFLAGAAVAFKFDGEQKAKGQALLVEYRKRADAIRTDEWKARVKRNRTVYFLQWELGETQRGPWSYRLEKEYDEAMRPLKDLGGEFQRAVLALATPQQQADAVEAARQLAEKYGHTATEADLALLRGALQPDAKTDTH
jgi:hypothetical protein